MDLSLIFENAPHLEIEELFFDSRKQVKNGMFFCLSGLAADGHKFVNGAIDNGAVCIVHSEEIEEKRKGIAYIKVEDVAACMSRVASRFYQYPTKKMTMYGVTGTNGKSTITNVIRDVHSRFEPCGYIGTISLSYGDVVIEPELTTPDAITIQRVCHDMVEAGMKACSLEVSSHGLEQQRVAAVDFDVAIFTNLTWDHLDFHGTIENYLNAKKKLFKLVNPKGTCVLNVDDKAYEEIKEVCNAKIVTYGIQNDAMFRADNIELGISGSKFTLIVGDLEYQVETNLVALYNVYNVLAAIAGMVSAGLPLEKVISYLNDIKQVDGRLERIDEGQPFNVIVDYAHTPDAIEKICEYARLITPEDRHIIAVFGSAGKRDVKKRPVMGSVADRYCDNIILTDDDPRSDDPQQIADEIRLGIQHANTVYIPDRVVAIRQAIEMANVKDTILILGKGDDRYFFSDKGREPYVGDHVIARQSIRKYYLGLEEEIYENE